MSSSDFFLRTSEEEREREAPLLWSTATCWDCCVCVCVSKYWFLVTVMTAPRTVAEGEIIRQKEAMDSLIHEVSHGEDDSLPPSLRSALEVSCGKEFDCILSVTFPVSHQRGWGNEFLETIKGAKNKREKEIDKICSRHYGDFLMSVQELLQMRGPASSLSTAIEQINKVFEDSFQDLSDVIKTLETLQQEREHSRNALNDIHSCRDLTHIIVQAKKYLAESDYYSALTSIEHLREELKHITLHPFKNALLKWLPDLTDELLNAAKTDLVGWFGEVKKQTQLIGTTLMRRHAKLFLKEAALANGDNVNNIDYVSTMSLETIYRLSNIYSWGYLNFEDDLEVTIPDDFFELPSDDGERILDELLESLAPLHKALHMHYRMDMLPELRKTYCETRELIISNNFIDMKLHSLAAEKGLVVALPNALSTLCGFFAIESLICTSTSVPNREVGVFSWNELQVLWADACEQLQGFCEAHIDNVKSPNHILLLKEQLLLASETLTDDAFGYKDDPLMAITNVLWSVFVNLQVNSAENVCQEAFITSGSQPMYVTTYEMFETKVKCFLLDKMVLSTESISGASEIDAMEEEQMELIRGITSRGNDKDRESSESFVPHTVPFSELVPILMRHLNIMMIKYAQFTVHNEGLVAAGQSLCNSIAMSFFGIARVLEKEMTKDGMETPLSKVCQIYTDASSLSYCCGSFREVIANVLMQANWFETIDSDLDEVILQCKKSLDSLAIEAQHLIFELLSVKMVDLLSSLHFVNWVPTVLPTGAHDSVSEIVDYLRATFMWITYLPQTMREAAHFTCCGKINQGILEFILSSKVPKINMLSIRALQLDIQLLDEFATGSGIPQLKDSFTQCRELINSLMHRDLNKFGESSFRKTNHFELNFPNLDLRNLVAMMEKVIIFNIAINTALFTFVNFLSSFRLFLCQ